MRRLRRFAIAVAASVIAATTAVFTQGPASGHEFVARNSLPARSQAALQRERSSFFARHPDATVVDDVLLTPEPETDVTMPELAMLQLSDGTYRVEAAGHFRGRQPDKLTAFVGIDPLQKTYVVFKWQSQNPTAGERARLRQWYEKHGIAVAVPNRQIAADAPSKLLSKPARLGVSPHRAAAPRVVRARTGSSAAQWDCWGDFALDIWTRDPPGYLLNLDHIQLDWGTTLDGAYWYDFDQDAPWAANPSGFGTHWYIDYWYPSTDPDPWWGTGYTQAYAGFHNSDFIGNLGATVFTDASGAITYDYGVYYWWSWDSGPWYVPSSYLLSPVISTTGYDGCY
jgi:hypothetical protein